VYVTGTFGEAAIGLRALQQNASPDTYRRCIGRYLRPEARVRAGMLLGRNRAASSCMDASDGLADALRQIGEASQVGMIVDVAAIPVAEDVRRWHDEHGGDPVATALSGGDDYELVFTVRRTHRGRLRGALAAFRDTPVTRIGEVTKATEVLLRDERGVRELPHGFEHFRPPGVGGADEGR
jgi:thiamine-monophosphate kinase